MANFYTQNFLPTSGLDVPNGLILVWLNQSPEFQKIYSLQSHEGAKKLLSWWIFEGRYKYPAMRDLIDTNQDHQNELFIPELGIYVGPFLIERFTKYYENDQNQCLRAKFLLEILNEEIGTIPLFENINLLSQIVTPSANLVSFDKKSIGTNLLNLIWLARDDLRNTYDFNSPEDASEIMQWWLNIGHIDFKKLILNINKIFEYRILFDEMSLFAKLNITIKTLVSMKLLFNKNINPIEISNFEFASILLKLYTRALEDHNKFYNSNNLFKNFVTAQERIKYVKRLVFNSRQDLSDLFKNENSRDYEVWWNQYGVDSYKLIVSMLEKPTEMIYKSRIFKFFYKNKYNKIPASFKFPYVNNLSNKIVNLVGIPFSSKGVSEDFRSLQNALQKLSYTTNVIAFPEQFSAIDNSSNYEYLPHFGGFCNVFIQSPFLTAEFFSKYGYAPFHKHKNYVFWQWEFSSITPKIALLPPLMNEIWTISQFVADGLKPFFSIPILVATQTVSIDLSIDEDVSDFIDDSGDFFYFMFVFDGESYFERKNPVAAINAFKNAFPISLNEKVRLIIKYHNLSSTDNDVLKNNVAGDVRIILIDAELSRSVFISLMKKIHCFISLHRAEGFGRLLAEAMLCEKPVIASKYSGNMDFMSDENSYLVDGNLTPVPPGQYQSIDIDSGAVWFDANIKSASDSMRKCFSNPEERATKAKAGLKTIKHKYNQSRLADFLSSKIKS